MSASDFFERWSRRKTQTELAVGPAPGAKAASCSAEAPGPAAGGEPRPLPTMDDVEKLTPQSDYAAFVKRGVDENVKRSALKKLFTDPHFNVMDGLDIYIDDYSKPDPIPPAMLAALNHAKDLLNPLAASQRRGMTMIEPEAVDKAKSKAVADLAPSTAQQPDGQAAAPAMEEPSADFGERAQASSASEDEPDASADPQAANTTETNQDPR